MQESRVQNWWDCFLQHVQKPGQAAAIKEALTASMSVSGNSPSPFPPWITKRQMRKGGLTAYSLAKNSFGL